MTTVRETLAAGTRVDLFVADDDGEPIGEAISGGLPVDPITLIIGEDEEWEEDLAPNSGITPGGTVWTRVQTKGGFQSTSHALVPASGSTLDWTDLLTDPPESPETSALADHAQTRGLGGHLPDDAEEAQVPVWDADTETWVAADVGGGPGGGASEEYVDDAVAAEALVRSNADTALAAATTAEAGTRLAADNALDGRLDSIEAVGPLASAASVTAEAAARLAADNAEAAARAAADLLLAPLLNPTGTGEATWPSFQATGRTGATATPIVLGGGVASGDPLAGTWPKGALVLRDDGTLLYCTVAGTPGTWVDAANVKALDAVTDLPQLEDSVDLDVTWDDVTVPGTVMPILSDRIPRYLHKNAGNGSQTGSTSALTLLTGSPTLAAGDLAIKDVVRIVVWGNTLNNTGADRTVTFRVRVGGSNLISFGAQTLPASAVIRPFRAEVFATIVSGGGSNISFAPTAVLTIADVAGGNDTIAKTITNAIPPALNPATALALDFTAQHSNTGQASLAFGYVFERIAA